MINFDKILRNEKYTGDLLLQKTFREDFRTKKKRRNTGELRKVYVKNSHDAIIDRQTFEAVQVEIKRRSIRQTEIMSHRNAAHDNSAKLFTGLIQCGYCKSAYTRKYTNAKSGDQPIWICSHASKYGKAACLSQRISEAVLIEKTKEVLGIDDLDRPTITDRISQIIVPEHHCLLYKLTDGSTVNVRWQHPSRRLSWTDEMREAARQKALSQHKKGGN